MAAASSSQNKRKRKTEAAAMEMPLAVATEGTAAEGMLSAPVANRKALRTQLGKMWEKEGYRDSLEAFLADRLTRQRDLEYYHRQEMIEDLNFYEGSLTSNDHLARDNPALRDLKVNIIRKSVNFMAGVAKARATSGSIIATGMGAYMPANMEMVTEEYSRRLSILKRNSEWKYGRNQRIDDACRCGIGYLHLYPMFSYETGNIVIKAEKPNWRNVYYDTNCVDFDNAEYCFVLSAKDADRVARRYPDCKDFIKAEAQDYLQSIPTDSMIYESSLLAGGIHTRGNNSGWGGTSRKQVITGTAYFRETVMMGGMPRDVMLYARIITNRDYSKIKIIGKPTLMPFTRPPVVPLAQSRYDETGLPYTPLVRDRRGMARTMNAMLRNFIHLISSRGIVANISQLAPGTDPDNYLRGIAYRLGQPNYVIPEYGPPNSVRVENHAVDGDKMLKGLQMLFGLSNDTSDMMAAMLSGDQDNAEVMRMLKNDAAVSVSSFHDDCDKAVKRDNEIMLSYIEALNGHIDYGWHNEGGRIIAATSRGDTTIQGTKAWFQVDENTRDDMINKAHLDILQALISKMDGPMGFPLYQIWVRALNMPDGHRLMDDLKDMAAQLGLPSLKSAMTQEEQAAQQAMQQERKQKEDMLFQAELAEKQAGVQKDQSQAYKNQKAADEPQGLKEQQMHDTISRLHAEKGRLQQIINQLKQQGVIPS